ncbi:MAG: molybdenum cofactor biosynthesis protein MoaE [Phycisphaerae bacterium]
MPEIVIRFYGPARDLAGEEALPIEIDAGQTVGDVAGVLAERYPKLGAALGIRLAVNRAYVALDQVLADGDEVAVIPPVSGGAPLPRVALTREAIDTDALADEMRRDEAGAIATFVGVVRADTSEDGKTLSALEYHAYEEMAVEQMQAIRRRAGERFEILDAAIVHRLGRLDRGEASIAVIVVSAHREPAFDACRWIVDAIKTDVPIWKKDVWADGSNGWVDPTA